ncbi:hypothetical protein QQX98_009714 [Neonectria punicea]|uniref:Uncharacterized protein n=1 Tax=Neonectria punicea TaxID=979145 RepID=A0ABR1GRH7_9HYPO
MCHANTETVCEGVPLEDLRNGNNDLNLDRCPSAKIAILRHLAKHQGNKRTCHEKRFNNLVKAINCHFPDSEYPSLVYPRVKRTITKIFNGLVDAGVVKSTRLADGGYTTTWPAYTHACLQDDWDGDASPPRALPVVNMGNPPEAFSRSGNHRAEGSQNSSFDVPESPAPNRPNYFVGEDNHFGCSLASSSMDHDHQNPSDTTSRAPSSLTPSFVRGQPSSPSLSAPAETISTPSFVPVMWQRNLSQHSSTPSRDDTGSYEASLYPSGRRQDDPLRGHTYEESHGIARPSHSSTSRLSSPTGDVLGQGNRLSSVPKLQVPLLERGDEAGSGNSIEAWRRDVDSTLDALVPGSRGASEFDRQERYYRSAVSDLAEFQHAVEIEQYAVERNRLTTALAAVTNMGVRSTRRRRQDLAWLIGGLSNPLPLTASWRQLVDQEDKVSRGRVALLAKSLDDDAEKIPAIAEMTEVLGKNYR